MNLTLFIIFLITRYVGSVESSLPNVRKDAGYRAPIINSRGMYILKLKFQILDPNSHIIVIVTIGVSL